MDRKIQLVKHQAKKITDPYMDFFLNLHLYHNFPKKHTKLD